MVAILGDNAIEAISWTLDPVGYRHCMIPNFGAAVELVGGTFFGNGIVLA
jgi:hypothetical protein